MTKHGPRLTPPLAGASSFLLLSVLLCGQLSVGCTAASTSTSTSEGTGASAGETTGPCLPYGDGNDWCCDGEENSIITGVSGAVCTPPCGAMGECPAAEVGEAQCVLGAPPQMRCAVTCIDVGGGMDCPPGSTCKDLGEGTGVCTWP